MPTNREKKALYLLAVVVVVIGSAMFFYFRYTDLMLIENQIKQTTFNIQRILSDTPNEEALLASIKELEDKIRIENDRFYKPGEIDLSTFSNTVMELMLENDLDVIKVQNESKPNSKYVNFQFEGNAFSLAKFLKQVSTLDKYWSILEITLDNKRHNGIRDGKEMNITMRIIYEIAGNNNS